MATTVRDVIIRTSIEAQRGSAPGGGQGPLPGGHSQDDLSKAREGVERLTRSHENFGRESLKAFMHASHGVLSLTRGIGMLALSGEEDLHKLMEGFFKLEAAVSVAKGALKLGGVAAEIGLTTAQFVSLASAVGAVAVVYQRLNGIVEEGKRKMAELAEEGRRAREMETQVQQAQERNSLEARESKTNLTAGDVNKAVAEQREREELQREYNEGHEKATNIRGAIDKTKADRLEAERRAAAGKEKQHSHWYSPYDIEKGKLEEERYGAQAKRLAGVENDQKKQLAEALGGDIHNLERQRELGSEWLQRRKTAADKMAETGGFFKNNEYEKHWAEGGDPAKRAERDAAIEAKARLRADPFAAAMYGMNAAGMYGAPGMTLPNQLLTPYMGTDKEISEKAGKFASDAEKEFNEFLADVTNSIREAKDELAKITSELAEAAKAH